MNFYKNLLDAVRKADTAKKFAELHNPEVSDNEAIHLMFLNFRGHIDSNPSGLRLTYFGVDVLKEFFTCYEFPQSVEASRLTSRQILYLERTSVMPWAYSNCTFTLFDQSLSLRFKLVGTLDDLINSEKV